MNFCEILKKLLKPHGKQAFLASLPKRASILDVGCGNDSPYKTKAILPHSHYTGIDIGDYNQTHPNIADSYIISKPETFTQEILQLSNNFDAVISSHNLEHCNDRDGTLLAMLKVLKPKGKLFLSFPCEQSVGYPSRYGTLNYYDDCTHKENPPHFEDILRTLKSNNFDIIFSAKNYSPLLLRAVGMIIEPYSQKKKKVFPGTWAYWGFESIIIAKKKQ